MACENCKTKIEIVNRYLEEWKNMDQNTYFLFSKRKILIHIQFMTELLTITDQYSIKAKSNET